MLARSGWPRFTRRSIALVCTCLFMLVALGRSAWSQPTHTERLPEPRLVELDDRGVTVELETSGLPVESILSSWSPCPAAGGDVDQVGEGLQDLPSTGLMIGVPADGEPSLTVLESDPVVATVSLDGCAVSRPARSPAEIVLDGFVRHQRVVVVSLRPVVLDADSANLVHYRSLRVRLDFGAAHPKSTRSIDEGPFEVVLKNSLINYQQSRTWRAPAVDGVATPPEKLRAPSPAFKIEVDEDGFYEMDHGELQAAGVPVGALDPRTFRLLNRGVEHAIELNGAADGSFDPGDHVLFYGQENTTRHSVVNVYWLTWGGVDGLSISSADGTPGVAPVPTSFATARHMEEDHQYFSYLPSGANDDYWHWETIFASSSPATGSYSTLLNSVASGAATATFRALLKGHTLVGAPLHHVRVYLNEGPGDPGATWLCDEYFAATATAAIEADFPHSELAEGLNTFNVVVLAGAGESSVVLTNYLEVVYHDTFVAESDELFFDPDDPGTWRCVLSNFSDSSIDLFDITDPTQPLRITNADIQPAGGTFTLSFEETQTAERRFLALTAARRKDPLRIVEDIPADLLSTTNGADYILISHTEFLSAVAPLATLRTAQGLRVEIVDVHEVYDEFSHGIFEPAAIHDFLAYAYANWQAPAPSFVLLVGDGHYDPKDNHGTGQTVFIPPYLAHVDPWMGETAAENRFVTVSGADILPDMHIGRLPVQTAVEAADVVAKISSYEQTAPLGGWDSRVLFVADDTDPAGAFPVLSDGVADNHLPSAYTLDKIYWDVTHTDITLARQAIVDAINNGCLVVNYIGHAANAYWAAEHLFDAGSIPSLTNADPLPLIVAMTGLEGRFHLPMMECLAEDMVGAAAKGAVASWSATGAGVATGHYYLNRGLFDALFTNGPTSIGQATTQAKLNLYTSTGSHQDLIDTFVLLGDPASRLHTLDLSLAASMTDSLFIDDGDGLPGPGDTLRYETTITNTGVGQVGQVVFSCVPDTSTTLSVGSVTTSQGAVTSGNVGGDTSVAVDVGTIPIGTPVNVSFHVTINDPPGVNAITTQAIMSSDIGDVLSDDPDLPGGTDPTTTDGVVPVELMSFTAE